MPQLPTDDGDERAAAEHARVTTPATTAASSSSRATRWRPACPRSCPRCRSRRRAEPPGARAVARRREQPAGRPRRDEPRVGDVLRPRDRRHRRGLRPDGRAAEPPGAARLAGDGVPGTRLEHEGDAPADRDVGDVSAGVARDAGPAANATRSNVLLARGPRFRVEAEMVRDWRCRSAACSTRASAARASSRRSRTASRELSYGATPWTDQHRRGPLSPGAVHVPEADRARTRDARRSTRPTGDIACVRAREESNTPLQALTLLNDTVFVEAAQALARRVLEGSAGGATTRAARSSCSACAPAASRRTDELAELSAFVDAQLAALRDGSARRERGRDVEARRAPKARTCRSWRRGRSSRGAAEPGRDDHEG